MNTKYTTAMVTKVCHTPGWVASLKEFIKMVANGEPIIAPPPNPMMAKPVAMPRRSGNHFTKVLTGEM